MKKSIIIAAAGLSMAACTTKQSSAFQSIESAPDMQKGNVTVYVFDNWRCHVYESQDVMADCSFIIEGENGLVLAELPLFKENAAELESYIQWLNKPIVKVLTDYHLGGSEGHKLTMVEGMSEFIDGPIYSGMMQSFGQAFGDAMVALPEGERESVAFGSTQEWAGVSFTFHHGAASDFPGASIVIGGKVCLLHWSPNRVHISPLQIGSREAITAEIEAHKAALASGAEVFVGGHGVPATKEDAAWRLAYLEKMQECLTAATAEEWTAQMKAAYPALPLEENLGALAEKFYGE